MIFPKRIQGTDGVRGKISFDHSDNPVGDFIQKTLISPSFFELYTYSFGLFLKDNDLVFKNRIVLGRDPRDESGKFLKAASQGLRKAGFEVINVGILPTPAIPLYAKIKEADASVMLTASHNPPDQHGIKLFLGSSGLKFLPKDDERLSSILYQQSIGAIQGLKESGELHDDSDQARQAFVDFSLRNENSWLDQNSETITLIIDPANGALSRLVKDLFEDANSWETHLCNHDGSHLINEFSGVAEIEGLESLSRIQFEENTHWQKFEALRLNFELGKAKEYQRGEKVLISVFFDGDGDRCFLSVFLPENDAIRFLSGDALGLLQAQEILQRYPQLEQPLFFNTIESDLTVSTKAQDLGYKAVFTEVGDKWILNHAYLDFFGVPENAVDEEFSSVSIVKEFETKAQKKRRFQIGFEESGHCITPAFLNKEDPNPSVFSGNGVKTALNSIAALQRKLSEGKSLENVLNEFLPDGVKKTLYIYNVNKTKLGEESLRERITVFLNKDESLKAFEIKLKSFKNDPEMIFFEFHFADRLTGTLFIRNSGTENKTSLYVRSDKAFAEAIVAILSKVQALIYLELKDKQHQSFLKFRNLLAEISKQGIQHTLENKENAEMLKKLEFKEKLIEKHGTDWVLAESGKSILDQLKSE